MFKFSLKAWRWWSSFLDIFFSVKYFSLKWSHIIWENSIWNLQNVTADFGCYNQSYGHVFACWKLWGFLNLHHGLSPNFRVCYFISWVDHTNCQLCYSFIVPLTKGLHVCESICLHMYMYSSRPQSNSINQNLISVIWKWLGR